MVAVQRLRVLSGQCCAAVGHATPPDGAAAGERRILIGGELVGAEGGRVAPVINPALGEVFDYVPDASKADLDRAVAAAKEAFKTWKVAPHAERAEHFEAFAAELERRADEFAIALTKEQGKPLMFAKGEVAGVISEARKFAVEGELKPEVVSSTPQGRVELHYIPRGVVGGITPWNFPLAMAANKLLPAVITGNTVVLKPSPYTPLSTVMLSEVVAKTFPPGVMNILSGSDSLGQHMVEHPDIKHISFTGSAATGKKIMATGAPTLKKVTLELGGNDAAIVLPNTDVSKLAPKIFNAAMFNTGQVCIAIKRVYVHESQYEQMVGALGQAAKQGNAAVGDGMKQGTRFGPLNNKPQLERIEMLVEDAKRAGGRVVAGGQRSQPTGKHNAYFYEPTIVADVDDNVRLVKEEQFGPALPILKYQTVDEALDRANASEYGLGGSVWGNDEEEAAKVALKLESGQSWVNHHLGGHPKAPFGGVKSSGIGKEGGGQIGLKEFVDMKSLFVSALKK